MCKLAGKIENATLPAKKRAKIVKVVPPAAAPAAPKGERRRCSQCAYMGILRGDGMVRSHGKTKENKEGCPGIGLAPAEPVYVGTVVGAGPPPPSDSSPGQAGPAGPTSEASLVVVVLE